MEIDIRDAFIQLSQASTILYQAMTAQVNQEVVPCPSIFPKASGDRVSNPKFKKGKGTDSPNEKSNYGKCEKSLWLLP